MTGTAWHRDEHRLCSEVAGRLLVQAYRDGLAAGYAEGEAVADQRWRTADERRRRGITGVGPSYSELCVRRGEHDRADRARATAARIAADEPHPWAPAVAS